VLLVHTETLYNKLTLQIENELLDPPNIEKSLVRLTPADPPPLVLVLGCRTGVASVPFQAFPIRFRQMGAAVVVSTICELFHAHAPALAEEILREINRKGGTERTAGEMLRDVRRRGVAGNLPVALALLGYGDADWYV
jgi:hypothetical protein